MESLKEEFQIFFLDIEINGINTSLNSFTNSSPAWDYYTDLELGTRGFENWAKQKFVIIGKRDSDVKGEKGNTERFYLLKR